MNSTANDPRPGSLQAVLFDYGLVLTGPPDPAAWEEMRAILKAEEPAFHAAYWRHRLDYDRGTLTGTAYWTAVAQDLRRAMPEPQLSMLLAADVTLWTQLNTPMVAWAAALQRAGVRTGILSNLGDAITTGILERMEWLRAFAHHTFSHRLGMTKPELAIYRHAAEGLGVPPGSVLFVDDREDNIQGALAAGMQALRYVDHEQFVREFRERGLDAMLPDPSEVANLS